LGAHLGARFFKLGAHLQASVPPRRCPQPRGLQQPQKPGFGAPVPPARHGWKKKHLLALGRSANPSKPTNTTSRPGRAGCQSGPQLFSLARASTVGKPSKAYKPHQPARPAGLRVARLRFHWLAFRRKKTLQNPPNPTKPPSRMQLQAADSKQHQRRNLRGQPPFTWQLSARGSLSPQMKAEVQRSS